MSLVPTDRAASTGATWLNPINVIAGKSRFADLPLTCAGLLQKVENSRNTPSSSTVTHTHSSILDTMSHATPQQWAGKIPDWAQSLPHPKSSPSHIEPSEVAQLIRTKQPGVDFVVVDTRKQDWEVNLRSPASHNTQLTCIFRLILSVQRSTFPHNPFISPSSLFSLFSNAYRSSSSTAKPAHLSRVEHALLPGIRMPWTQPASRPVRLGYSREASRDGLLLMGMMKH